MNKSGGICYATRRRFLGLLAALGTLMPWSVRGEAKSGLSKREAAFYRKGRPV